MSENDLKQTAIERIDNLEVIQVKKFMDSIDHSFNSDIKNKTKEYINTLDQAKLMRFLGLLSGFVKQKVQSLAIKNILQKEDLRKILSDVKAFLSQKKLGQNFKLRFEITEVASGKNISIDEICGLIDKLCESKDPNFIDCKTSVVGNLIDIASLLEKSSFSFFERENYDQNTIEPVLLSETFLAVMAKIRGCKVKNFLLNLNLDDWIDDGKYAKLEAPDSFPYNLEKEKTLLNWESVHAIKFFAQMKKILFDKKMNDKEKMWALDGIIENNKFAKINFKSKGGILAAYADIFKSQFSDVIEKNLELKNAFDKTYDLIKLADNFNSIDKFFAVSSFIFIAVAAVCSLGLIFGIDKLMGNSFSYDVLRSRSPFKSLQKENFKDLIKKLGNLEEEVNKVAGLKENKKDIYKDGARN